MCPSGEIFKACSEGILWFESTLEDSEIIIRKIILSNHNFMIIEKKLPIENSDFICVANSTVFFSAK